MSDSKQPEKNLHFDIHASVVFQLGERLISDVVQALVELVKNSYDADATFARVVVNTKSTQAQDSAYENVNGYIIIEDNGNGMDLQTIERGWLTISNSMKRQMKEQEKTTLRGRTPLGDKGLGRLGVQRLGYNVEIFTRPEHSDIEYYVAFSWRDFERTEQLTKVNVTFHETKAQRKKGTRIIISDLKDISSWTGDAVSRLETDLSQMISPYKEVRDFQVIATIDGKQLQLAEITEKIRQTAELRYRIDFDGKVLHVKGKARLAYFWPDTGEERENFRRFVELDEGKQFTEFLLASQQAKLYNLQKSSENGWFLEYEFSRPFKDLDSLELVKGEPANPGSFYAEIDGFDLGRESTNRQSVFDRISEYRKYITDLSGIRVYRDGFGVRVDRDWLKLGEQWTSAKSYYTLRPNNTLGYVAISAKENSVLEEKTDREGFVVTPYYANFYELLQQFVRFTIDVQNFMRRGWTRFRDSQQKIIARVPDSVTPEDLSKRITQTVSRATTYQAPLNKLRITLEKTITNTQKALESVEATLFVDPSQVQKIQASSQILQRNMEEASNLISEVEQYIREVARVEEVGEVLKNQVEALREQLNQFYETVSLGLTAEALSHEIHNITNQLAYRTQQITQYLREQNNKDSKLISYTEHVNTSIAGLRRQMAHLSPSLRYVREKRERIPVDSFFAEVVDYYKERFQTRDIILNIQGNKVNEFVLFMNKGKLLQIIDNLFLNSEYWLREDMRLAHISHGTITVDISRPFVRVSDNGRGVDPSVETTLFEPFVTTKGRGKGRGLGLFVVQQLLDSEGCHISLLPARNAHNRQYVFEIDFTGVLDGRK